MFKKKGGERVLPNQSTREIADTKRKLDSELRASLYLYDGSKFIICAIAGNTEHGDPIVLDEGVSDDELGRSICDKLLVFNPKNPPGSTESALSSWKAYNVSGARSGKAFGRSATTYTFEQ